MKSSASERLFEFGTAQPFFPPGSAGNFAFGTAFIQTPKLSCTISKTRASVSSGYPNTEKQMKARGRRPSAFIVSRCLDTPMKHEARVLEITSHDHAQTNHKQRLLIRIVCYLTFLRG